MATTEAGEPRRRVRARLTRRGRTLALVILTLLLFGAFSLGRETSSAAGLLRTRTVVVQPGETLWSLAARLAPTADPRITVQQLEDLNHLRGPALVAGQVLRLPLSR